jgi:glycosyltransferase involved in cell wall biosynthesis
MKILILAPQPFYQERGTPIAVKLLVEVLGQQYGTESNEINNIHLLTYHEGTDVNITGVQHSRIRTLGLLNNIRPGISIKKIIADIFFLFKTLKLLYDNRHEQFTMIHAIEESVFIAWFIKLLFNIPYVYDMDSSLSQQTTDRWRYLRCFQPLLEKVESLAIRQSLAVIPVCDALVNEALRKGAKNVFLLTDVAVGVDPSEDTNSTDLYSELDIPKECKIVLYVGNLQPYQGVDLLIDSFITIASDHSDTFLVIIGGSKDELSKARIKIPDTPAGRQIKLAGPRPFDTIGSYLSQAEILTSPRIEGHNTPMKIYNYLASGRAILATNILSHTQILTHEVALLCEPNITDMAKRLSHLLSNTELRARIGKQGSILARNKYTQESFKNTLIEIYKKLETLIT